MSKAQTNTKKGRITVVDVAREAEVSVSAVSRAFNPNGSCSPAMKAKVMVAAEKLGYTPNRLARGLKSRSSLIGILMTDFENPAYLPILDDFTRAIQSRNCHTLLIKVSEDMGIEEAVELVLEYHVDGLIVTSSTLPSGLTDACKTKGTPVVIFARHSREDTATAIYCDNIAGGKMAADLLLDSGYERPAFVGGLLGASTTTDRQRGFIARLIERGCEHWQIVEGGRHSYDTGYQAACKLFNSAEKPDSIFFADDIMACGGMDAIRHEFNLRVPEDVGVIGVDDIRFAGSRAYNLSTIRQPFTDMVNASVDALFDHLDDPELKRKQIIVPCTLVERNSTKKPR